MTETKTAYQVFEKSATEIDRDYDDIPGWVLENMEREFYPGDDEYDEIRETAFGSVTYGVKKDNDDLVFNRYLHEITNPDTIDRFHALDINPAIVQFKVKKDKEYEELPSKLQWPVNPTEYMTVASHDKCHTRLEDIAAIAKREGLDDLKWVNVHLKREFTWDGKRRFGTGKGPENRYEFIEDEAKEIDPDREFGQEKQIVPLGPFQDPLWEMFL